MTDEPKTPYPDDEFVPKKGKRLTYDGKGYPSIGSNIRAALKDGVGKPRELTPKTLEDIKGVVNNSLQALVDREVLPTAQVKDVTQDGDILTVTIDWVSPD